jgi:hypothetical protein
VSDIGNSTTKAFDHVWSRFLGRLEVGLLRASTSAKTS